MSEKKNKSSIIDKLIMGAVIGAAVGSVIGASVDPDKLPKKKSVWSKILAKFKNPNGK